MKIPQEERAVELELPLLAFLCSDEDDENQRIVFAASGAIARAQNASSDAVASLVVRRKPSFDEHAPGPVPVSALLDDGWYTHCASHLCQRRISYDDGDMWAEDGNDPNIATEAARTAAAERDEKIWLIDNPEPEKARKGADWKTVHAAEEARRAWSERKRRDLTWIEPPMLDLNALRFCGTEVFCSIRCQQEAALSIARTDLSHADAEIEAERRWPGASKYSSGRWPQTEPRVSFRPLGFEQDVTWHVGENETFVMPEDLERWKAAYGRDDAQEGVA